MHSELARQIWTFFNGIFLLRCPDVSTFTTLLDACSGLGERDQLSLSILRSTPSLSYGKYGKKYADEDLRKGIRSGRTKLNELYTELVIGGIEVMILLQLRLLNILLQTNCLVTRLSLPTFLLGLIQVLWWEDTDHD